MRDQKAEDINQYIADFPAETQLLLEQLRFAIREAAPQAQECIKYSMPCFKGKKNLVYFAGYARHIGFYPGAKAIETFKEKLHPYKFAKGSIQFPLNQPLPLDLIRNIVQFRVQQEA